MFTEGRLIGNEVKMIPEEAEIFRNNAKLFIFLVHGLHEEIWNKTGQTILFRLGDDFNNTVAEFSDKICGRKRLSKEQCQAMPDDKSLKCQQIKEIDGCEECPEEYCDCDKMYPWGPCSVTCGYGVKIRHVLNASSCNAEMDCSAKPCLPTQPRIFGPLDLVVILDESKSFKNWHIEQKKSLEGVYRKMMNLIVNNFEIGFNVTRVAVYCTGGISGELKLKLEDTKTIDDVLNVKCTLATEHPDNLHNILRQAAETLKGQGSQTNVEKAVFGMKR